MLRLLCLLTACAVAISTTALEAQDVPRVGMIDGVVSDTSMRPLESAEIAILGTPVRVFTGSSGRFQIRGVPIGQYLVIVRRLGYRPTSALLAVGDDTLRLSYTLTPTPPLLEGMRIVETSVGVRELEFLHRARAGEGTFITREQIEARGAIFVSDLLRPVLAVDLKPTGLGGHVAVNRRGAISLSSGSCPFRVFLDEIPLPSPVDIDLLPPPETLMGIEIYPGPATTPPRYNSYGGGCGIILIWSK